MENNINLKETFKKCDEYLCMKDLYDSLLRIINAFKNHRDCNQSEIELVEKFINENLEAMINRITGEIYHSSQIDLKNLEK